MRALGISFSPLAGLVAGLALALPGAPAALAHVYVPSAAVGAVYGCANQPVTVAGVEGDKASAILGGQPSALDLISAQQADNVEISAFGEVEQVSQARDATDFLCSWGTLAPVTVREELSNGRAPASDDFLGSSRVYIGATPLDDAWRRVSAKSSAISVGGLVAKRAQESDFDHLARVNSWVNRKIEFVEDQTLYGMSEYWATAAETLRLSKGDCEDFAILKYQILVDSGVDPGSIYLTLVWDAIRRRDVVAP